MLLSIIIKSLYLIKIVISSYIIINNIIVRVNFHVVYTILTHPKSIDLNRTFRIVKTNFIVI